MKERKKERSIEKKKSIQYREREIEKNTIKNYLTN